MPHNHEQVIVKHVSSAFVGTTLEAGPDAYGIEGLVTTAATANLLR